MSKRLRLLFFTAALLIVPVLGASTAQASRGINVSTTNIAISGTIVLNGVLTCEFLIGIGSSTTIAKTTGTNQASATGGYLRNCSGSLAGNPNTGAILGPINVQYRSFAGTLPNITKINLLFPNFAFSINTIAGNCLYGGSLDGSGLTISSGTGTAFDFTGSSALPRVSGGILCPTTGTITGQLRTFLTGVTVTLV